MAKNYSKGEMHMKENSIGDSEYKLMEIIWDYAPIAAGELSTMCEMIHGWKKTTVYTMLKRLQDKGFIQSDKSTITFLVGRDDLQRQQSEELVEKNFKGSLPMFVNAFLGGGKKMSKEDAQSLIDMIEQHTEE